MVISTVHVIFKTHLDVGFTDFAHRVVARYRDEFIPRALDVAEELRHDPRGFRWTAGSWILTHALHNGSPAQRRRVEAALAEGMLQWHALPFTTQTELQDARLFQDGLRFGRRLDAQFGRTTRVAKMTDVPGHTVGMVPLLAHAGVEFLHIGVNPASEVPELPPCFIWRAPDGSEIVVNYDRDYGSTEDAGAFVPLGTDQGLFFAFTNDNIGPHSTEEVLALYQLLERKHPGAQVRASSLQDFWDAIRPVRDGLPVVTDEIGDSWIHGAAADPIQLSRLNRLKRARAAAGSAVPPEADEAIAESMLLVTEHTWGLDHKTFLPDFVNHRQERFETARAADEFNPEANPRQLAFHVHGDGPYHYSTLERSWAEQRDYTASALREAHAFGLDVQEPSPVEAPERALVAPAAARSRSGTAGGFHYELGETGALIHLARDGVRVASPDHQLGLVGHECFVAADYDRYLEEYVRDLDRTRAWAVADLGRLGLAEAEQSTEHATALPRLESVATWHDADAAFVQARCVMPPQAVAEYGAAARVVITYRLERDRINLHVTLTGARACRMPHATWVRIDPERSGHWRFEKLGTLVDPEKVVAGGNRHLHAVERALATHSAAGTIEVTPFDANLAAPGTPGLLRGSAAPVDTHNGLHFVLANNVWSTNYRLWVDGDLSFDFEIALPDPTQRAWRG
ncbi:DUF5054 domain-containing protein [Microbacterium deminutum]|uniref:Glycoside hydrolase family 38 N-terminal domain-containing protein n=1 Tax=Microbacterium deminutum TaxID=344164 RepID=A0ABN2R5I1_9MICO